MRVGFCRIMTTMAVTPTTEAVVIPGLKDLRDPMAAALVIGQANEELGRAVEIPDKVRSVVQGISKAVADTNLHAFEGLSPALHAVLLKGLGEAATAVDEGDRSRLRIALTRIEHALRGASDRLLSHREDPREALAWIIATTRVPKRNVAALIGADERAVQRWTAEGSSGGRIDEFAPQIAMLAEAVSELRHVFTPVGSIQWFDWPRDDLGDRPPRVLLRNAEEFPLLRHAIARTRSGDAA
jgi:hypothetical protein